jgi:FeS assembly SUF system regulator
MFKLSRMADYGVVVLSRMARAPGEVVTAPELAERTALPQPTVAKTLKLLTRGGLLTSHRGTQGGYSLDRAPAEVTVAEIIAALDGPVALTACVDGSDDNCAVENLCPIRGHWERVNEAVKGALEGVTLADLTAAQEEAAINFGRPAKAPGKTGEPVATDA